MMLVIDKRDDIEILKSMGADSAMIKRIFSTEGWLISLLGVVSGILLGLIIALAQQHFGLVKMPGNFMVDAYPVVVKFSDIVLTFVSVSTIGYIMSRIPKV
jgi:ABC-type lipoprotein release transport system permease subunit